jgi:hypothetical protein
VNVNEQALVAAEFTGAGVCWPKAAQQSARVVKASRTFLIDVSYDFLRGARKARGKK